MNKKAGYHRAKNLQVPENMCLVYLPFSNPELTPVESFWRDMQDKAASLNVKDEQAREDWTTITTKIYFQKQIAALPYDPYIKNAVQQLISIINLLHRNTSIRISDARITRV